MPGGSRPYLLMLVCLILALLPGAGCSLFANLTSDERRTELPPPQEPLAPADNAAQPTLRQLLVKLPPVTSYEAVLTAEDGSTFTQVAKLRNRSPVAVKLLGGDTVAYLFTSPRATYFYQPLAKALYKVPLSRELHDQSPPSCYPALFNTEVPVTVKETLRGIACWRVDTKEVGTGAPARLWVGRQWGLLRQVLTGHGAMIYTYSRINQVPETEFALPAKVPIKEIGELHLPPPPSF